MVERKKTKLFNLGVFEKKAQLKLSQVKLSANTNFKL